MQGIQEISVIPKLIGVTHTMSDYLDVSRAYLHCQEIFSNSLVDAAAGKRIRMYTPQTVKIVMVH